MQPKSKPFIVGTWYRPPDSTSEIMRNFDCLVIEQLESSGLEINIILGDINCNVSAPLMDRVTH